MYTDNGLVTKYTSGFTLHWTQMADGHLGLGLNGRQPFWVGLNGQVSHLRPVMSPGLKLSTQSQMADSDLKVPDLKVCVQNTKFIVCYFFFDKNVFPNIFLKRIFHCFQDHYTP